MKKIWLFIPLLFLAITNTTSQNKEQLLDSSYVYLYNQYYTYKYTDSLKAKTIAAIYLKKAERAKDTINMAMGYTFKSEVYKNDSIYIDYLDHLIEVTSKKPTKLFPAFFHYRKGHLYALVRTNKNEALKEILLAKKYAESTGNDSLAYAMYTKIGRLVAQNGNRKKAIEIYRECYEYYKDHMHKVGKDDFFAFIYNYSTTYSDLSENDSALYYNKIAYQYSFEQKDTLLVAYSKFRQGQIHHTLENHQASVDSIKGAMDVLIDDENYLAVSQGYSLMGDSYIKLKEHPKALAYFGKVDSMYNTSKIFYNSESQRTAFKFLYQHYKDKDDTQNQLHYLNKIISWDSIKMASDDRFEETLYDNYEKDNLERREALIEELEKDISISNIIKYGMIGISVIALLLFFYEYNRRKKLKRRFDELASATRKETGIPKMVAQDKSKISVPKEVIDTIVKKLEAFERKNAFTSTRLSLNSLANDLKTNPNYLSKIINHRMGIGFSSYINELRINYVLDLLDKNPTIRKYSIEAIGNEVGYKNAQSFSNAFYKKTGLKPSYYIKQLNKIGV
ncbi:helix-turn-helix domain-containing protein [Flavobacteriaceae bacterium S356]|uniref:Helix-turn-helix domain-containing protein n=1 Tax=Asprobacillus argus TaxID=3076534 RepID=A0ABU3LBE5_9FLAO|nr:helix-turn-helix domain-containing protein [Flavobacteriaceae bacterium S356]